MVRAGDYLRDALAVAFLLLALGSAWDAEHQSAAPDYLVPVTLLSILSLALPYLSLASVLPRIATPARLEYLRLLANVPYLVVVLVALARAYQGESGSEEVGAGRGVGLGIVLGLAGIVLAAQERSAELHDGSSSGTFWKATAAVLAGVGVALSIVSGVLYVIEFAGEADWDEMAVVFLDLIFFAGVPVLTVRGLVRGDWVWRDVAVVLGIVGLVAALWAEGADQTMEDAWSLRLTGPQVLLWPAIGAAAAAPAISYLVGASATPETRVSLASRLFQVTTVVAVMAFLIHGFRAVDDAGARPVYLTAVVLSLLILAIATVGRSSLVGESGTRGPIASRAATGVIAVAMAQLAVLGVADDAQIGFDVATIISTWVVCAITVVGALSWRSPAPADEPAMDAETSRNPPEEVAPDDELHVQDESIWDVHTADEAAPSGDGGDEEAGPSK